MLGQILRGRYKIINELGRGGFGVTYIAEDTDIPENPKCVVKQLQPLNNEPEILQLAERFFRQEAEILKKLGDKHQQIPRLLAFHEREFCLVQEYIEGHDLSQELPDGKQLTEKEVIQLLKEILEVLAFVHQEKVIHRDIKPSNIRRRKPDNKIVLIDFGAVKAVKEVQSLEVKQQGQIHSTIAIGHPGYIAPEQANRNPKYSSDVYSVGVIAIQALTGINPDPRQGKKTGLPKDENNEEIIWRDLVQVRPELANILDRMVCHHWRQRYQTADEALQAIKQLDPKPVAWKPLIGLGIAAAIVPLIVYIWTLIFPPVKISTYDNPHFKIEYPESWQAIQQPPNPLHDSIVQFLPKNGTQPPTCLLEVVININPLNPVLSLNEYKNQSIQKIKQINPNSTITDQSTPATVLSNWSAYKLIYQRQDNGCNLKVMEIGTVNNGKAYYVTYTAPVNQYDDSLPAATKMIDSFKIK